MKVTDVPAVILNDRTMVPIYLLKQAGVNYSYDAKKQIVDVKSSSSAGSSPAAVMKDINQFGGSGVSLYEEGGKSYAYTYVADIENLQDEDIHDLLLNLLTFGTDKLVISYDEQGDDGEYYTYDLSIAAQDYQSYINGKLTEEQLLERFEVEAY